MQNERIRSLLGIQRLLEEVFDGDYAVFHCSPVRLEQIWRQVRRVSGLLRGKLAGLLAEPSRVPDLEAARRNLEAALELLSRTVLDPLEAHPLDIPAAREAEVRRLLCASVGKVQGFVQNAFREILAADPRSVDNRDYFFSRRFARDVEESGWLYRSVSGLRDFITQIEREGEATLAPAVQRLRIEETLPPPAIWAAIEDYLVLLDELAAKLKRVVALPGIRVHELEILGRYDQELPEKCFRLREAYGVGRAVVDALRGASSPNHPARGQAVVDLVVCHATVATRLASLAADLHAIVLDLAAFFPLWLQNLGRRRALEFYRPAEEDEAATAASSGSARAAGSRDASAAGRR